MAGGENHENGGMELEKWMRKLEKGLRTEREKAMREKKETQKLLQTMMGRIEMLEKNSGERNSVYSGQRRWEIAAEKIVVGENGKSEGRSVGIRSKVVVDVASLETPGAGHDNRWRNGAADNGLYLKNYGAGCGDKSDPMNKRCYGREIEYKEASSGERDATQDRWRDWLKQEMKGWEVNVRETR